MLSVGLFIKRVVKVEKPTKEAIQRETAKQEELWKYTVQQQFIHKV
jgi:hypothetical protein